MARNERKNYYIEIRDTRIGFRSPSALYDSIKRILGIRDVSERNARSNFIIYGIAGETLPRLTLKLSGGGVNNTGIANQAQSDGNDNARVFCAPDKIEDALTQLVGRTTRGKRISGVRIPKRRVYV